MEALKRRLREAGGAAADVVLAETLWRALHGIGGNSAVFEPVLGLDAAPR